MIGWQLSITPFSLAFLIAICLALHGISDHPPDSHA
jgi:hypothetical protein